MYTDISIFHINYFLINTRNKFLKLAYQVIATDCVCITE